MRSTWGAVWRFTTVRMLNAAPWLSSSWAARSTRWKVPSPLGSDPVGVVGLLHPRPGRAPPRSGSPPGSPPTPGSGPCRWSAGRSTPAPGFCCTGGPAPPPARKKSSPARVGSPPWKEKVQLWVALARAPLDHRLQHCLLHDAVGGLLPLCCLIVVKAVAAAQAAQPRGRLQEHLYVSHPRRYFFRRASAPSLRPVASRRRRYWSRSTQVW